MRASRASAALSTSLLLAGCGLSSTIAIAPHKPRPVLGRAVLAFSVDVEAPWPYRAFAVQLDRYDLKREGTAGGCLWFERVTGELPSMPLHRRRYFTFLVPAGAYAYSPFNGADLDGPSRAFIAPPGRVTYVGDFTFERMVSQASAQTDQPGVVGVRKVRLDSDVAAAESALAVKVEPARVVQVRPAHPFLCTM